MASTTVIDVRYFGTSKVKVGDRVRHLRALVDNNGELDLDMGGLRREIRILCNLPPGADIALTYIDEDYDVVTLVDDNDLREAMRQRLKSFRIDVQMNDDKEECGKNSSSEKCHVTDAVNVTSDVSSSNVFDEFHLANYDHHVSPSVKQSEDECGMMCHASIRCGVCNDKVATLWLAALALLVSVRLLSRRHGSEC
ncbi:uncharacterized protein LOC103952955 isoform X1 [Pyrus x bretschneideri]|uniref:uncharacterized protein LOC103952955 isoform X1 n=2 Tax=Pyrus x bretschneideri TaxID=225117 RepID=UPI002030208E|nr:uncharacterized protein LOC103952955 isoform X1 [Pyrus x bretschneideri]